MKLATKKIRVELGQDTPAYASFELTVGADLTDADIINLVKEQAENQSGDLVFEPSYDFSGLRVVSATHANGDTIAEDLPIEPSPEDLGIVAMGVLKGTVAPNQLIMEAERQGVDINPEVASMFERLTFPNDPMKSSGAQKMRG
jgi:hypothetical protein